MAEFAYTKLRSEFGRQCSFADRPVEVLANIRPNEEDAAEYIHRNPVDRANQIASYENLSEHYVGLPTPCSSSFIPRPYHPFPPAL